MDRAASSRTNTPFRGCLFTSLVLKIVHSQVGNANRGSNARLFHVHFKSNLSTSYAWCHKSWVYVTTTASIESWSLNCLNITAINLQKYLCTRNSQLLSTIFHQTIQSTVRFGRSICSRHPHRRHVRDQDIMQSLISRGFAPKSNAISSFSGIIVLLSLRESSYSNHN